MSADLLRFLPASAARFFRFLSLGACLGCVLAGCASGGNDAPLPAEMGSQRPEDVGTVLIPNAELADKIEVVAVHALLEKKDCITAIVQVRVKNGSPLKLQGRFLFKDQQAITREISGWQAQSLPAGKIVEFKAASTISGASRFLLQLEPKK